MAKFHPRGEMTFPLIFCNDPAPLWFNCLIWDHYTESRALESVTPIANPSLVCRLDGGRRPCV